MNAFTGAVEENEVWNRYLSLFKIKYLRNGIQRADGIVEISLLRLNEHIKVERKSE